MKNFRNGGSKLAQRALDSYPFLRSFSADGSHRCIFLIGLRRHIAELTYNKSFELLSQDLFEHEGMSSNKNVTNEMDVPLDSQAQKTSQHLY